MSVAYLVKELFEETLRELDQRAEHELCRIGHEMRYWLEGMLNRMPCDNWRYEFDRLIAKMAREHVFFAEESCRGWIEWLRECNEAAEEDARALGSAQAVRALTRERLRRPDLPQYPNDKPAPFDPDYPQLRRNGNSIMERTPPAEWIGDARAEQKPDAESNQLAMADDEAPTKPAQTRGRVPRDNSKKVTFRSIRRGKPDVVVESVVDSLVVPKGTALGNVAPELRGLLVKLDAVVGGDRIPRLSIVDLYMPVKIEIARTARGINVPDEIVAKTRGHEQKHADAFAAPIAIAERTIALVNNQLKLIDTKQLTMNQIKELADATRKAVEERTKDYLQRRIAVEIVRQSYHLDHYDEMRIRIEGGKFVEDPDDRYSSAIPGTKEFREAVRPFLRLQLADQDIDKLKHILAVRNALRKEAVYFDEQYQAGIPKLIDVLWKVSSGAR